MLTAEQNTNELFLQYEKLLHKWAHSYKNTTGIEEEELFSEACVAYMNAIRSYDSYKNVKLSTWISSCVKNRLNTFVTQFHADKSFTLFDAEEMNSFPDTCRYNAIFSYADTMSELSKKGQFVCELVLRLQNSLDGMPPKLARGKIQRELREQGWVWSDIWETFRELKHVL